MSVTFDPLNLRGYLPVTLPRANITAAVDTLYFALNDPLSGIWSQVKADGRNLRVLNSDCTKAYPFRVVSIDKAARKLRLQFNAKEWLNDSDFDPEESSDLSLNIGIEKNGTMPGVTDPLGQYSVFPTGHFHWPCDEVSNALQLVEASGSGRNFTRDFGSFESVNGAFDKAISCSNLRTQQADTYFNYSTQNFTVSLWYLLPSVVSNRRLIGTHGGGASRSWAIQTDTAERLLFFITQNGPSITANTPLVTLGTWNKFTFVRDYTNNRIRLYSNGTAFYDASAQNFILDQGSPMCFPGYSAGTTSGFHGSLNNLHIQERALSNEAVATTYRNENSNASFWEHDPFVELSGGSFVASPFNGGF